VRGGKRKPGRNSNAVAIEETFHPEEVLGNNGDMIFEFSTTKLVFKT